MGVVVPAFGGVFVLVVLVELLPHCTKRSDVETSRMRAAWRSIDTS